MNKVQLETYRQKLLTLGKRLQGNVESIQNEAFRKTGGEASGSLSNAPLHLADLGSDSFEQEMSLGVLENEEQMLEQIAEALTRIEQGTFGRCQECGQEIGTERLQALPYTPHCIDCARKVQAGTL